MGEEFFQNNEKTWEKSNVVYKYATKNTEYIGDYFSITKIVTVGRKTPIYYIFDNINNCLGEIKWFSRWRKFCFYPEKNTVWDSKCLSEIIQQLDKYNNDYKNK